MHAPDVRVLAPTVFCCLAALLTGCGDSKKGQDGASAGDGLGPANGDGPAQADAIASTMAYVTFRLNNTGTRTLYLHSGCTALVKVTSVASGTVYDNALICACECASASCKGELDCGACPPPAAGEPIAAGSTRDITWTARATTSQTKNGINGLFQCLVYDPIPTGAYTASIDLYASTADAAAKTSPLTFTMDFVLGTENATVEIPIQ